MNPWHDISYGSDAPEVVRTFIEVSNKSNIKYELDKESGLIALDRVLYGANFYPANYGFIPKTYCDDKDPLDILVLSSVDFLPGCLVNAKVIGVMQMVDGGEQDDKIIAVCADDKEVSHINDISQLPEHKLAQIKNFFEEYKKLQKKSVEVKEFYGREKALEIVNEAIELYNKTF